MDQPTIDRLLSTLEGNATANTKLATSVDGMVVEMRVLGEKVGANTAEVKHLCAAHKSETESKARTSAMMWSVVKHPSTILLTALAVWVATNLFGVAPGSVEEDSAPQVVVVDE